MNRKLLDELVDRLADAAVDRVEATLGIGPQVAPDPARGYAEALAHRQGAPAPVRQPAAGPHLSDVVEQFVRLSKADLLRYYEALPKLPSNAAKKWPGLDARAVLDATAALDVDRLAPKSINKRLSCVKAFLSRPPLLQI